MGCLSRGWLVMMMLLRREWLVMMGLVLIMLLLLLLLWYHGMSMIGLGDRRKCTIFTLLRRNRIRAVTSIHTLGKF
jgi:uncharacterized SAM-binding protein YcdF (DUF218 family)